MSISGDETFCLTLAEQEMIWFDADRYCYKRESEVIGPNTHDEVQFLAEQLKKFAWSGDRVWLNFRRSRNRDGDWYQFHNLKSQMDIRISSRFRPGE